MTDKDMLSRNPLSHDFLEKCFEVIGFYFDFTVEHSDPLVLVLFDHPRRVGRKHDSRPAKVMDLLCDGPGIVVGYVGWFLHHRVYHPTGRLGVPFPRPRRKLARPSGTTLVIEPGRFHAVAMAGHALLRHHRSDYGEWEAFEREPHPALAPYVRRMTGWVERTAFTRRREVPHAGAVLIINFENRLNVSTPGRPEQADSYHSFFAGLASSYVVTESAGFGGGVQLDFTPIGAYLFTGIPADELANRVVHLEDILGVGAVGLIQRLEETPDWDTRLDMVEQLALDRLSIAPRPSEGVAWAFQRLEARRGLVRINDLCSALDWKPKQLIERFRHEVGLPPKQVARIIRFQRAVQMLTPERPSCLADVAFECGYFDQAHFAREFREFAGSTPGEFLRRMVPESGGVLDSDSDVAANSYKTGDNVRA
jgi:AraC-like DNA-binding protein